MSSSFVRRACARSIPRQAGQLLGVQQSRLAGRHGRLFACVQHRNPSSKPLESIRGRGLRAKLPSGAPGTRPGISSRGHGGGPDTPVSLRRAPARLRRVRGGRQGRAAPPAAAVLAADPSPAGRRRSPSAGTACSASTCSATATPTARRRWGTTPCRCSAARRSALLDHLDVAARGGGRTVARARTRRSRSRLGRARARARPADPDAGAGQRPARLCARLHPAARGPHLRRPGGRLTGRGAAARAARHLPPRRLDARLDEPGPEAVGVRAPGPLLRAGGAAGRGAPAHAAADARDRPPARPRAPVQRLGHAGARDAERPHHGGHIDHGAVDQARSA